MDSVDTKTTSTSTHRHYVRVMAFVLGVALAVVIGTGISVMRLSVVPSVVDREEQITATSSFARSAPSHLVIPKLGIDTSFESPLKLNSDKTVAVPKSYDKVGWYEGGATPGEVGPAVILGHVDSYKGAAVFYHLGQLAKGDEVQITREDGTTATFEVQNLVRYERKDFPTELVYGQTDKAVLRLVTCSGIFNHGKQEYSHNLVVYATLRE